VTGVDAPRIGVVGTCNVDLVVRCRQLARPGETVLGDDVVRLSGGKGANQAAALARLGANVSLMASLGNDESGEWLLDNLRRHGVNLEFIERSPRPTGTAFITVDDLGENEIVVSTGANADLDLAKFNLQDFDVVLAQMEISTSVLDDAAQRSRSFILNVAPAAPVSTETLARCIVVIANEVEAESLDLTSLKHCVVTLGAGGAVHYQYGREVARAKALEIEPVDTVGAGDVFCAAYALMWAKGSSDETALRYAVTAGSLATLALGAQGALPTDGEVMKWIVHE
jgi:ribokinase